MSPDPAHLHPTATVIRLAGCTFRQADYWTRQGALRPTIPSRHSGDVRRWSPDDIALARAFTTLANAGAKTDTFARVAFDLAVTPDLWDSTVVVPVDKTRPVVDLANAVGMDGWIIDLRAVRDHVARALGTKVTQAV